MCFVFIWEPTATCATYSINCLVFITEMKSVYCAVRTGSLNKAVCASYLKVCVLLSIMQCLWHVRMSRQMVGWCGQDTIEVLGEKLCYIVHHRFHTERPWINLCLWNGTAILLSYGADSLYSVVSERSIGPGSRVGTKKEAICYSEKLIPK